MSRLTAIGLVALLVVACAAPTPVPTPSATTSVMPASAQSAAASARASSAASAGPSIAPAPTASGDPRVTGWREDIGVLVDKIEQMHPDIEQQVPLADLESAANDLSLRVPELTDDQVMVGIVSITTLVSRKGCDAHTGAYVWGDGSTYPVDSMPLRLWLFGDDVYVVDALPPYVGLVGQRIDEIAGRATADVVGLVEPIVPRDNDQTVRLLMPRFLLIPQILRGLGLAVGASVTVRTTAADGTTADTQVTPVSMSEYNAWAGPYGLHLPADPGVLYLSRMDERLWWQPLPDGSLYVQYNEMQPAPFDDLGTALNAPPVKSVVLDLRHNFGGEVYILDKVSAIFDAWLAADPTHHLEIATARNTFSAGSLLVAQLAAHANVDVSGEAMGGCPTGWGNNRDFMLRYSGLRVSVSTTFEIGASATDQRPTIEPNLPAELTFADWLAKRDPILEPHSGADQ